ncbi:hypothetical protein J132_08093 [Termitomyces sp. J132]|nr:hypothetical protein H2248_002275 [Termitomyces sp. 'cryptogamus']KNZ71582.1 hypothetical protein J132_08093 [Termitomyces sp. J132]
MLGLPNPSKRQSILARLANAFTFKAHLARNKPPIAQHSANSPTSSSSFSTCLSHSSLTQPPPVPPKSLPESYIDHPDTTLVFPPASPPPSLDSLAESEPRHTCIRRQLNDESAFPYAHSRSSLSLSTTTTSPPLSVVSFPTTPITPPRTPVSVAFPFSSQKKELLRSCTRKVFSILGFRSRSRVSSLVPPVPSQTSLAKQQFSIP